MVENKTLAAGTFVLITLILSGSYIVSESNKDQTYSCNSTNLVGICEKLGANMTRCYYNSTRYKVCSDGWKKLEFQATQKEESLCFDNGENNYCCESGQMKKGVCDFIIRK
jgi:hypothetical protein